MVLMDWCDIFLPVFSLFCCRPEDVLIYHSKVCQDVAIPFVPDCLRRNLCVLDAFVVFYASCAVL
jgi:hypothetical protein